MTDKIQIIKTHNISWINIIDPTDKEIEFLKEQYKFDQLNLNDAYGDVRSQRAKFDDREHYLFLVLHFPIYHKDKQRILPAEVDFFIGKDYLITIHNNELEPLKNFLKLCQEFEHYRLKHMSKNPSVLLYEILDRLLDACFPMIDHIGEDIENIEDNLFLGKEKEMVKKILTIKRNITNFRRIMQSHKNIIKKLIQMDNQFFPKLDMTNYYHNLIDTTKDIWEVLNTEKETIDAIYETNESFLSFKLSDIMKTLTIFSVIIFPLTLIASIFGMNTTYLPLIGHPQDFWLIISLMVFLTFIMLIFFKRKNWL